ncbi:MAG: hypothetical protein K9K76_07835 [Halanaerobiales bacterium]|nr:hypothetical protein [Halanaerobiales bacterium]
MKNEDKICPFLSSSDELKKCTTKCKLYEGKEAGCGLSNISDKLKFLMNN